MSKFSNGIHEKTLEISIKRTKTFNNSNKNFEFNIRFSLHKENIINLQVMKFSHFTRNISH